MVAFIAPLFLASHRRPATFRCSPHASAGPSSEAKAPPHVQKVVERLREELPNLFNKSGNADYSLYADSVTFEDPLNKFRGVSRYAANIDFLNSSPVFSSAALTLYDVRVIGQRQDTVRTRWALQMVANLPWQPCVAFTGQSDYVVDDAGKVFKHIDYWDSLEDSAFFSPKAVLDLLSQCKPGRVSPLELGGFQLLRRTSLFEVRKFDGDGREGVVLKQTHQESLPPEWTVVLDGAVSRASCLVKLSAVKTLSMAPTAAVLDEEERRLRSELEIADCAEVGQKCFYVKSFLRGSPVFEVWVDLISANATVDE